MGRDRDIPFVSSDIADDLAAYALGAVTAEGQEAIEELARSDSAIAEQLEDMLETTALMSMHLGECEPPAELKDKLLSEIADEAIEENSLKAPLYASLINHIEKNLTSDPVESHSPADGSGSTTIWGRVSGMLSAGRIAFATSLASFAVVAILLAQLGSENMHLNRKVADLERRVESSSSFVNKMMDDMTNTESMLVRAERQIALQDAKIEEMTTVNDALRASMNDQISLTYATLRNEYQTPDWLPDPIIEGGSAYVYLLEHRLSPVGALIVGGMAQAPSGEEYRLYLIDGDQARYAASFDMNEAGYCTVLFQLPAPLSDFDGAHITRELSDAPPDASLADPARRYKPQ